EPQQLQSGLTVARDVRGDRFQAQAVADGFRHERLVLDDQHAHTWMLEPPHIAGISKNRYPPATGGGQTWGRDPQQASANNAPSDLDSQEPRPGRADRHRGDRRIPRLPAGAVLIVDS